MKVFLFAGAIGAGLSVILGAFAAHGLKSQLSEYLLGVFQTGVQYQMYHSLALILLYLLYRYFDSHLLVWSAAFMLAGMVMFSGSLYALALTQVKWFGPITPMGGLCFIIGWGLLVYGVIKHHGN